MTVHVIERKSCKKRVYRSVGKSTESLISVEKSRRKLIKRVSMTVTTIICVSNV